MSRLETFREPPVQANANCINRNGEPFFEVTAIGFVHATPLQAWRVLTNYERLPDFVPDLLSATLVSRNANMAVVEQTSSTGLLLVSQVMRMRLRVVEQPFSTIDVSLIEGDMKRYETHWDIEPVMQDGQRGTRVTFSGRMEPDFYVPPLLARAIVQANVKKTVEAVVAEMNRHRMH